MRSIASHAVAGALYALCLATSSAVAHGNDDHARPAAAAPAEQKPWGIAGDASAVQRTVELTMSDDMRFTPDRIEVRQGETVRLVMTNTGKMLHELVIGTQAELDAHAALMARYPGMTHDEPYMAHVPPAGRGQIVWRFNRAGEFGFACLIAGHYQAGMVGRISVAAPRKPVTFGATGMSRIAASGSETGADLADGEVRKVDLANGKITLRHGEIRSLDMPPMTMVFQLRDAAQAQGLAPGDKVRFRAVAEGSQLVVTSIERVR